MRIRAPSAVGFALASVIATRFVDADTTTAPAPAPKVTMVEAGPLRNQAEAAKKCPKVSKSPTKWSGTWKTTKPRVMSVCGCTEPLAPPPPATAPAPPPTIVRVKGKVRDVETRPLFDQAEAKSSCPGVCTSPTTWTGAWRTTKPGIASVCACQDPPIPAKRLESIATGPIHSSADAKAMCTKTCKAPLQWSGEWHGTGTKAATCDCYEPALAPPPATPPR